MLPREAVLAVIDRMYALRVAGDREGLAQIWAPEATYQMAGGAAGMPLAMQGPADARMATGRLAEQFDFHSAHRLETFVEGAAAAVRVRCEVSRPNGRRVLTDMVDLWTFDDEGRATSTTQFIDTALMLELLAETPA